MEGRARPRVRAALGRARCGRARIRHHQAGARAIGRRAVAVAVAGLGIPNQNVTMADTNGPDRVDDRRRHAEARRPRRHDPGIVGRRHESVGRLPRGRGVSPHRQSGRRPHLDRERAGRRWRDAGGDRRGRLCRRHPRADHSRSPDRDRQGNAAGHARHPARGSRALPRAMAQAAARRARLPVRSGSRRAARRVPATSSTRSGPAVHRRARSVIASSRNSACCSSGA